LDLAGDGAEEADLAAAGWRRRRSDGAEVADAPRKRPTGGAEERDVACRGGPPGGADLARGGGWRRASAGGGLAPPADPPAAGRGGGRLRGGRRGRSRGGGGRVDAERRSGPATAREAVRRRWRRAEAARRHWIGGGSEGSPRSRVEKSELLLRYRFGGEAGSGRTRAVWVGF